MDRPIRPQEGLMTFKGGILVMLLGICSVAHAQQQVQSVPAVPQGQAQGQGTGWPEYDELVARLAEAQGAASGDPRDRALQQKVRELEVQLQRLVECESSPVTDPRALFEK